MIDEITDKKKNRPKKIYRPPELKEYGRIRDLTAGGSGRKTENHSHQRRRYP
jgi:hypothetical protein